MIDHVRDEIDEFTELIDEFRGIIGDVRNEIDELPGTRRFSTILRHHQVGEGGHGAGQRVDAGQGGW
jgi:hypothetical protein